jgi:hypothetical protein
MPVTVAIGPGGLDQGFDLAGHQVLPGAKLDVRSPGRRNCSENFSWRDQPECRICQWNLLASEATVRTFYKLRTGGETHMSQTVAPRLRSSQKEAQTPPPFASAPARRKRSPEKIASHLMF